VTYTVSAREDDAVEAIDDDRRRRSVVALFDLLQTHLDEYGGQ
jgi:hypothetical protein